MVLTIIIKTVFTSMSGELPNDGDDKQNEEGNFTHPVSSQAKQDECKGNKNGIVCTHSKYDYNTILVYKRKVVVTKSWLNIHT